MNSLLLVVHNTNRTRRELPLTFSVFWGSLASTLIGGTLIGTILTLVFLSALYTIWFKVKATQVKTSPAMELVAE